MPRKAEDADVFAALVKVMMRVGPEGLTLRAIANEAGITAGALVQRFGSKQALLHAQAKYAATTGDIGLGKLNLDDGASPLTILREKARQFAQMAKSPKAAARNLAYLQKDLADPVLHRNLLRSSETTQALYQQLVQDAVSAGELKRDIDVAVLARLLGVTLVGSFLSWAIMRKGRAVDWILADFDALVQPYLAKRRPR